MSDTPRPVITFSYCTQCNWLLRTAWMAQELLSTFGQDIASVTLIPATGGLFQITLDGEVIWNRKERGGFPDVKVLKQMVRDRVWPERDLGHIDRAGKDQGQRLPLVPGAVCPRTPEDI